MFGPVKYFILISLLLLVISVNVCAVDQLPTPSSAVEASDYFKVLLGLIFVIALFLASSFLFKRFGHDSMRGHGQLRIVDGLHLGSRERLMLVELKGKQILLAITPGQINKLDAIDVLSSGKVSADPGLEVVSSSNPAVKQK